MLTKFHYDENEVNEALNLVLKRAEIVQPVPLQERISSDPGDDNIIATAVSANCDCLISGDKDLFLLKKFQNVRIIRPSEFWKFEASSK